jgi:hypothetical protein
MVGNDSLFTVSGRDAGQIFEVTGSGGATVTGFLSASLNISASAFYGDGAALTGIAAGGDTIFSEVSSTRACTTSSIGIGHTTAATPQALLYLTASDALGHDNQPYFYIDSVNLSKPPLYVTASSYATSRLPLVGIGTKTGTSTLTVAGDFSASADAAIGDLTTRTITGPNSAGTSGGSVTLSGSNIMITGSTWVKGDLSSSLNISGSRVYAAQLIVSDPTITPGVFSATSLTLGSAASNAIHLKPGNAGVGAFRSGSYNGRPMFEIWADGLRNPIAFNGTYMGGITHTQLLLDTDQKTSTFSGSVRIYDGLGDVGLMVTGSTQLSGSFAGGYRRVTVDYEVKDHLAANYILGVSASLTTKVNIVLPSASVGRGHTLIIKDEFAGYGGDARTEQYAITASVSSSSDLVEGDSAYYIYGSMGSITLYSDGVDKWFVV